MLVWSNIISKAKAKAKAAAAKVVIAQNHQGWDAVRGRVETATDSEDGAQYFGMPNQGRLA